MDTTSQNVTSADTPIFADIETNGLKDDLTCIWCITLLEDGNYSHYGPDKISSAVERMNGRWVIFHNGINFDLVVIKRFYPWFNPSRVDDTFVLSCLFEPDRFGHGLADWGQQFGVPKPVHEDWTQYSEEMKHRNVEDVRITKLVWDHLSKERASWDWEPSIRLEYRIAELHARQEANGVGFDMEGALSLHSKISAEVAEIDDKILRNIPPKWVKVGETMNKPFRIDGSYNERCRKWIMESYPGLLTE